MIEQECKCIYQVYQRNDNHLPNKYLESLQVVYFTIYFHNCICVYILGEAYQDVLQKPPELTDVLDLVRNTSSSWFDIGSKLHVSLNVREGLRKDVSLSDDAKLEKILNEWIKFETVDVTWENILKALQAQRRNDIVRETLMYLKRPDIYSKYIKKDDFTPVPHF